MTRPCRLVLTLLSLSAAAFAQESRGSITGLATDASGALIPRVKVSATNRETKVATTASTNATGNYTIFYLIPGVYDLTAELAGFATAERHGIEVRTGDKLEIDFQLQPAGTATTLEVAA